jgi:pilus assembly protein CpaB
MILKLGILAVLVVALIAVSIFGLSILNQSHQQQAVAPPQTQQVLVAAALLPGGTLLQPTDIVSAPVAAGSIPAGAAIDTPDARSAMVGSMVRTSISQGAPILESQIIHPGDHGFLAAVLAPGMRAVTIGVDAVSSADGLIWPGDNVDVLLTQTLNNAPVDKSIAAEVVLSNIRVIATGSELVKSGAVTSGNASTEAPAQTVTLEVTPDQASRCLVASNLGHLSLIVHSAVAPTAQQTAAEAAAAAQPVWAGDVSPALTDTKPAPQISTVHVFEGSPTSEDYSF